LTFALPDDELEVCRMYDQHKTCCTRLMERRLHQAAVEDMHDIVASTSRHLKDLLVRNSELYKSRIICCLSMVINDSINLATSPADGIWVFNCHI